MESDLPPAVKQRGPSDPEAAAGTGSTALHVWRKLRLALAGTRPPASKRRRIAVWALIVLAALVALVSSLTIWVKEQLLVTDAWVEASGELIENATIRDALAIALTDSLFEGVEVEAWLEELLPEQVVPLAPPLAALIREQAPVAAEELLASPAGQAAWKQINLRLHTQFVKLVEGEDSGDLLTTEGEGSVVLDLQPLVDELASRLGLTVELAPGAAQFTILTSDQLAEAQETVRVLNVLSVLLGLAVLVLLALAVFLAKGFRREALRGTGVSLLIVGIVVLVVRRVAGNAIVDALTSATTEPAGAATWLIATSLLKSVGVALVAYGVTAIVGAWAAGPTKLATRLRQMLAPSLREHPVTVYAAVFVAILLGLYFGPAGDTRRVWGILILGALAVLGVEALRRQTLREFPETQPTDQE